MHTSTPRCFRAALLVALLVCAMPSRAGAQTGPPADLDAVIEKTRTTFDVPGIAVAVVKDGRVVYAKGFGARKTGDPTPVDADTVFGIASLTKAFTTAAISMLAEEGKLAWDDRVVDRLPGFQLYDPYVTHEITIRDLVTHRSGLGLGSGDLLIFPTSNYTRDEIVHRLRFLKPASSFRSKYAYDNLLYLVAGQIIRQVTGKTWDEFVAERIFAPVGMTGSTTTVKGLLSGGNVAAPHSRVDGALRVLVPDNLDNGAPAASINSSVNDLARWMIVQLHAGAIRDAQGVERGRLFREASSKEMWSPQTIMPVPNPPPPIAATRPNFATYGLGWGLSDYRGHKIASHTGGLAGYVSKMTLVPELKLGVVVLTNQEEGGAFQAPTYHVLDAYLGAPKTDWVAAYDEFRKKQRGDAAEAMRTADDARAKDSKPSLPIEKYAGRYVDAWRDDASITLENGRLVLRFGRTEKLVGDLEHWQYDTFVARWRDRSLHADAYVTFSLGVDGSIAEMKMLPFSPLTDFSFDFQDLLFKPAKPAAK
jgi:CubicO group peptidase (beta-lactamase class C family)